MSVLSGPRWCHEAVAMCLQQGWGRTELLERIDRELQTRHGDLNAALDSPTPDRLNEVLVECCQAGAEVMGKSPLYNEESPFWKTEAAKSLNFTFLFAKALAKAMAELDCC